MTMNYSVAMSIMFEILRCKQTAKDLAEEFEISTRTVYRYIDDLCGAGVPIISNAGRYGGFEMSSYYKIREFFLTRNEKSYLINLLKNQNDENAKLLILKLSALATM
ncbi:MAG TPA: hypothetical protein DCO89_00115 [Clostridiales bacterium]|nr:hypothetical protein [Clostridiales bacterium]